MGKRDRPEDRFTVRAPRRPLFAPTPELLLFDKAVEDRAVRLWGVLDRVAAGRARAIDSRAALADALGCSLSSVDRARRNLEESGWLDVERVAGEASRYTLHDRKSPVSTGVVTGDDTPNGRSHRRPDPSVTGDETPSSPVTTEERDLERRETPQPPQSGGAHPCEQHKRPTRGCCSRRDRERAQADAAAETERLASAARLAAERAAPKAATPPAEWEQLRGQLGRRPA